MKIKMCWTLLFFAHSPQIQCGSVCIKDAFGITKNFSCTKCNPFNMYNDDNLRFHFTSILCFFASKQDDDDDDDEGEDDVKQVR